MQSLQTFLAENNLSLLDLGGTLVGLFYIYYQFRASWKLWVASLVMSIFYIILNLQGELYALTGIYAYYSCAAIYGLWQWRIKGVDEGEQEISISHIPLRLYPKIFATIAALTLILAGILTFLHEEEDAGALKLWADAFTAATSIVSMWLLAKKYCEQWLFWFVVDGVNCALYIYLGPQYLFSSCLFGFYALTCFVGYPYWLKQIPQKDA